MDRERRHRPRCLECAGRVDAEELEVAADVAEAPIGWGFASRIQGTDDDPVADADSVYVRSDLRDRPRHLMADDLGYAHPVIHAAVRNVDVRAADATVGNVDAHFAGRRRNNAARPARMKLPEPS